MKLQLKQLFEITGETKEFSFEIPLCELDHCKAVSFNTPVSVSGTVCNRAGIVTLKYACSFVLNHVCDRCLLEFKREYEFSDEHILVQSLSSDDDDKIVCEDNSLDLNELAISDLLLQLPSKVLCRDDCKGLCFVCGQNLNEAQCECSKSQ